MFDFFSTLVYNNSAEGTGSENKLSSFRLFLCCVTKLIPVFPGFLHVKWKVGRLLKLDLAVVEARKVSCVVQPGRLIVFHVIARVVVEGCLFSGNQLNLPFFNPI